MGDWVKAEGPELTEGVEVDSIPENGMFVGQVSGEPVLLCRSEGNVYAVSARCPHYGAPLAEGAIIDGTIRCPWHHAAFDLRDGSIAAPPAFNPLPCWRTEIEGGRVRVTEPIAPPKAEQRRTEPESIVIIGGGAAGHFAAETLRREGYAGAITILSADEHVPFDKPNLSKEFLAGTAPEEWIPLRGDDFYRENRIDLRLKTRVTSIDTRAHAVRTDGGQTLSYDRLLIATGADPIRLSIPGSDLPHVFTLRTFADTQRILETAKNAKTAVVAGASFIGLEVAASLTQRGIAVHVVAPDSVPLERVMGPEVGAWVRSLHEQNGVTFHLGNTISSIASDHVVLSNGKTIRCELVVAGIGVRPATRLAEEAGLKVENGIVTDEHLQTSAPHVYAAGDLARYRDARSGELRRAEHWAVAQRQGEIAARNMIGGHAQCDFAPFFWSAHYDTTIAYVGYGQGWDSAAVAGDLEARNARITYRKDGRVVAVATIFRDRESLEIEEAMAKGDWAEVERMAAAATTE